MTAFETTIKLCEVVLDEYMGGEAKVLGYVKQDSEIHITYENNGDWFPTGKAIVNIYQYGVYLKEIPGSLQWFTQQWLEAKLLGDHHCENYNSDPLRFLITKDSIENCNSLIFQAGYLTDELIKNEK